MENFDCLVGVAPNDPRIYRELWESHCDSHSLRELWESGAAGGKNVDFFY